MVSTQQLTRFEWVREMSEEPILDVGCGDSPYFDETVDYTGLDKTEDSPDMQDDRPEDFIEADAHDLPIDDNSYSTVLLCEVLEHVRNPVQVISEANRVARNQVLITVPDEDRWLEGANPGEHERHERVYDGRILFDQCTKAGFSDNEVKIDHLNELPFCFWLATCKVAIQ